MPTNASITASPCSMRILIVEDNPIEMKLVKSVLEHEGSQILGLENGKDVLALLEKFQPDLILIDLCLPEMDGITIAQFLKRNQLVMRVPIVALTSYPELYTREKAIQAGCDAYFVKPFDTRKLYSQLRNITMSNES
ncbi:hypothetical protein A0128_19755 [Leptospira tipperaryensis]|uniref:Response regulatory domain-containing protein n=1 Tax=Leptospira tipperaryensis TaxID=2564040 RepID=A0A1D7V354_9LEPT|nr:response regulator [Leptospira tipperaryensis]AOP36264.1 hypothetical protein A0128_19755 [Leptospira tipperaryensis]